MKVVHALVTALMLLIVTAGQSQTYSPSKEVQVRDLPSVIALSRNPEAVLAASVDVILHDRDVCCGKNSALQDDVQSADPQSLANVAKKLQGRHLLPDGRPIAVNAEYSPVEQLNIGHLITEIVQQHAPLMIWNSHLYVVYGMLYDERIDYASGASTQALRKLLLLDTRFSDSRRKAVFDREKDDLKAISGVLFLSSASH